MWGKSVVASAVASMALLGPALAQQVPGVPEDVARPGGDLPGGPKIALVKIADGFNDPINVTNAGDGSGRIFVVERVGRVRVVEADGSVQLEPFLDLTNINPLGNDVQTGFVEQGLYAIAFHLSADAWRRLDGRARGRPLGPVVLKGKGEIEVYRCEGIEA